MSKPIIYVMQDGGDFYVYKTKESFDADELFTSYAFPQRVTTVEAAMIARDWFVGIFDDSLEIRWPNPFAGA